MCLCLFFFFCCVFENLFRKALKQYVELDLLLHDTISTIEQFGAQDEGDLDSSIVTFFLNNFFFI